MPSLHDIAISFVTCFAGLALETIPFLAIGTFLAALIHVFVPDRIVMGIFPKNRFLSILVASCVGLVIPICECATVPLARRLRAKGVPLSTVSAFLLAAPIVNPLTIVSTIVAFRDAPYPIFLYRLGIGLASAIAVAMAIEYMLGDKDPDLALRKEGLTLRGGCECEEAHEEGHRDTGFASRFSEVIEHTAHDFFDVCRYLVIGIAIASLLRAFLPIDSAMPFLSSPLVAQCAGFGLAYALSLCSSADAFVARSLFAASSYPAALCFLVLGPLLDLKNTILLSRFIKPRYLAGLAALVLFVCFLFTALCYSALGGKLP